METYFKNWKLVYNSDIAACKTSNWCYSNLAAKLRLSKHCDMIVTFSSSKIALSISKFAIIA